MIRNFCEGFSSIFLVISEFIYCCFFQTEMYASKSNLLAILLLSLLFF